MKLDFVSVLKIAVIERRFFEWLPAFGPDAADGSATPAAPQYPASRQSDCSPTEPVTPNRGTPTAHGGGNLTPPNPGAPPAGGNLTPPSSGTVPPNTINTPNNGVQGNVPNGNYFRPYGSNGFYQRGNTGNYLRGTNGFYLRNGQFYPDGNEYYQRGPDGLYRWYPATAPMDSVHPAFMARMFTV